MFIWVKFQNLRNPFKIRFQQLPWIVYKLYNKINVDGQTLPFCTNFAPVIVYLNVIYFSLNMGYNICNIHTQYINMLMKLYVAVNGTVLVCTPVTSFVFVFILMIGIWLFVVVTIFYIIFYSRHMNIFVFALFRIISFRLFFYFQCLPTRPCRESFGSTLYVAKLGFISSVPQWFVSVYWENILRKKKVHCT